MERIIKKIEEVKNNLGGFVRIQYDGEWEKAVICGGTFDIDSFSYDQESKWFEFDGRNFDWFYLCPIKHTQVVEPEESHRVLCDGMIEHTYILLLQNGDSPTEGITIDIDEITKVYNIKTFFKWLKKKLRRK